MTIMESDTKVPTVTPKGPSEGRLATLLRWGGAGAVGLSGLLYLLQGIENIDGAFRNWVYLGLVALLVGGGLLSRLTLKDAKGARLFFALATVVVPVQFAQLAGMIHELVTVGAAGGWAAAGWAAGGWLDFSGVTVSSTALVGAATALLLPPVAFAGFSVLAREAASRLTIVFCGLNGLLLLPARDSLAGMSVVLVLGLIALVLERRYFAAKNSPPVFRTLEGFGMRALFLLPLAIAATRFGMHMDALWGFCVLTALLGVFLLNCGIWTRNRTVVEVASLFGTLAVGLAWWVFAQDLLSITLQATNYPYFVVFGPIALLLFFGAERSPTAARFYRGSAVLLLMVLSLELLFADHSLVNGLLVSAAGAPLVAWGLLRKQREALLGGASITLAGLIAVIAAAIGDFSINVWILLAGLGVLLVLASSVIERHGQKALRSTLDAWDDVRQWK